MFDVPQNPRQRVNRWRKQTALDRRNDREQGRWLHPTKGWRPVSHTRSVCAIITADVLSGVNVPLSMMRLLVRDARRKDHEDAKAR